MQGSAGYLSHISTPTILAAFALVVLVFIVIKIGKVLLMAAVFGAIAGGASLSQGTEPRTAAGHAAVAFAAAAVMFFLVKMAKSMVLWLVITGAGVAAMLWWGGRA
jgi:hypothetical protein